ncbi:MAG: amidohydrolase family protein [Candidatus Kerfeldbacteria bacterium]|nr:amidohydrolase family protein [Candidatus Kerfeldbacteria bacterium]
MFSHIYRRVRLDDPTSGGPGREEGWRRRYTVLAKPGAPIHRVLIHGCSFVITVDGAGRLHVLRDVSLLIEDGVIQSVVPAARYRRDTLPPVDLLYDAEQNGGTVVTPGFVNAHSHPPMYLLRSSVMVERETANFERALANMAALERRMGVPDFTIGAVGDFTEQQRSGITSVLSHYGVFEPIDEAARDTGMRVINAISLASNSHPHNTPALVDRLWRQRRHFSSELAVAIHYVFRASPAQLRRIASVVRQRNLRFTLHLGELQRFVDECVRIHGDRPLRVLDRVGLLGPRTILSHGILLTDDEIRLIKRRGAVVVHLPTSNLIHRRGRFPYRSFRRLGATDRIALGTDSVISKNRLDLVTEAFQAKVMHQADAMIPFGELFRMMTAQAADLLGLDRVGRVVPGYRADLAFWALDHRGFQPYDPWNPKTLIGNMITYGARSVRDLMIDGQFIVSGGQHNRIDERALLEQLQTSHTALRARAGRIRHSSAE